MGTVHACARLMGNGLEVNHFVKVRTCCVFVYVCVVSCMLESAFEGGITNKIE